MAVAVSTTVQDVLTYHTTKSTKANVSRVGKSSGRLELSSIQAPRFRKTGAGRRFGNSDITNHQRGLGMNYTAWTT
jgi:hypothetical protein